MRIHTFLTDAQVREMCPAGTYLTRLNTHGSRSRDHALDVVLSGSGTHMNSGSYGAVTDEQAATWDEWGQLLSLIFEADPTALIVNVYDGAVHFEWATGGRYIGGQIIGQAHKRHRWSAVEWVVTGAYRVHECKCGALRRTLRYGDKWAASPVNA